MKTVTVKHKKFHGDGDNFFSPGDGDGDKIDRFYGCPNRPR